MRIENYFTDIQNIVDSFPVIRLKSVTYDKRGTYEGFIRGELYFADGTILHFREYIDVEITAERLMYAYQYTDSHKNLIFRYDNTGHHKKLGLSTYPHHKHDSAENNVIESKAPRLNQVLHEIEDSVRLSQRVR
ncbi:MAG: hypothetical protein DRQ49_05015 [Gammaproteobacteria bacterium]|nr:MAG: hypothetical protein DRQ49_05015 [Gammaproteobacteria bacterium]RKZ44944.1 MAG: hypothetical protein DRQ41_01480 [Gammaproteobacteria bacterium]RKZ75749.1 MAG: hypothetical protein DRQ57_06250 [Gammaproteobacteria bacterium]